MMKTELSSQNHWDTRPQKWTSNKALVSSYFFFPMMWQQVKAVTTSCVLRQQTKIDRRQEPLGMKLIPRMVHEELTLDFKGSIRGFYILVFLDILSCWMDIAFVSTTSMIAIRQPILRYFSTHVTSHQVCTDNGSPFSSHEFAAFAKGQSFHHAPVTTVISSKWWDWKFNEKDLNGCQQDNLVPKGFWYLKGLICINYTMILSNFYVFYSIQGMIFFRKSVLVRLMFSHWSFQNSRYVF